MGKLSKRSSTSSSIVRPFEGLSRIQPHAAGIDIGAHELAVCVPGNDNTQIVRMFGTYTAALHALAEWLSTQGIESVAAESTGVYWIPVFEVLESHGFACHLISAASIRRIPGRKSDVLDCQWIQTLHSYGLLADSFRPEAELIALRTLVRHRARLIEQRSPHILRMQKALIQMNIQLSQVLSDVTGKTGLAIIRAIVASERNPHTLATLRNYRCKKSEEEIALALTGTWREEHLFVLRQSLAFLTSTPSKSPSVMLKLSALMPVSVRKKTSTRMRPCLHRGNVVPIPRMNPLSRLLSGNICSALPVSIWWLFRV